MTDLVSLTLSELEQRFTPDFPKFRAKQVFEWLHVKQVRTFAEMSNIPAAMRKTLQEEYTIKSLTCVKRQVSKRQDTVKYLYGLCDGESVESVHMTHKHGGSLCISSQVGCKMGCAFCASGADGFVRNLTPSEMLLQLYETQRDGRKVDSIVIMGIGEPLDNFDNVMAFLELLQSGQGMSLRHVSLSTCGLVPQIVRLAELKLGLTLSVSLHAITDSERSAIMPINRKYGIDELLETCKNYFSATGRRISFEYALIDGVNDSESHARQLAELLSARMPAHAFHVNLIPVNAIGARFTRSDNAAVFAAVLEKLRVNTTVRRTMGADIDAACGQLRQGVFKEV
ncbi:MAG: 23S rRNA (adenine(2503)-C(2))-methyltransferase RlmN [Oscillospiraceae bacterium]|nr:23S rRNA (adenine(2503)-C(2))-methyltransferase RlmN [Oscillospiraceae bacterium]